MSINSKEVATETNLLALERERVAAQAAFDLSVDSRSRNENGQFATPPPLADAMVKLAMQFLDEDSRIRFLDPAIGSGGFFSSLLRVRHGREIASALGFETDSRLVSMASRLWKPLGIRLRLEDFTAAVPPDNEAAKPNLIVCNPPYVRHHHLTGKQKTRLRGEVARMNLTLSGLSGLYSYFVLLADRWLSSDGVAVWIVPAEFLDVNYGATLRNYLLQRVTTLLVHRFEPTDLQFADALVTSVILAFRKGSPPAGHQIRCTHGSDLLNPSDSRSMPIRNLAGREKWGCLFTANETAASTVAPEATLGDLFLVRRGLATGANNFFILEESEAARLGIPKEFLKPILPSPRLIPSNSIDVGPNGFPAGLPRLVLLDCALPIDVIARRFPMLHKYLQKGVRERVSRGYLALSRSPWYRQEQRPPAPIVCTYMARKKSSGQCLRFIRNRSDATAANVFLLLYPKPPLIQAMRIAPAIMDEIFRQLQDLPNIERSGRVYGGGLHKLEPRELAGLPLPDSLIRTMSSFTGWKESLPVQNWLAFTASL